MTQDQSLRNLLIFLKNINLLEATDSFVYSVKHLIRHLTRFLERVVSTDFSHIFYIV